jgi:hypothetical protein
VRRERASVMAEALNCDFQFVDVPSFRPRSSQSRQYPAYEKVEFGAAAASSSNIDDFPSPLK